MHTGSVLLIALFKLISCQASFLSTFDADRLSIKVRRSASATGIVGESVQLVTDHFIRKNVLDTKQWNKIVHESISSNSTVEAMKTLIERLDDPYSRYLEKPSMSVRYSKFRGISVSAGFTVARKLRLSKASIRRSLHATKNMETLKTAGQIIASAFASTFCMRQLYSFDRRIAMIPAALSVFYAGCKLYPHLFPIEVAEVEISQQSRKDAHVQVGDQILAINGKKVLQLPLRKVQKLLNDGDVGDIVKVTVGRAGGNFVKVSPQHLSNPNISAPTMRFLQPRRDGLLWWRQADTLAREVSAPSLPNCNSPAGTWKEVDIELTRQYVLAASSVRNSTLPKCGPGMGYISISEFNDQTYHDVCDAIKDLKERIFSTQNSSLRGLVFDLRGNPGGPIAPALDISALFLPKGKVLTQLASHGRTVKYYSKNRLADLTTALLLLVDAQTASASEILVEALCDNGRATSMGTRTVGKNVAQAVLSLSDGSGLCFTVREYFTPSGRLMGNGHTPKMQTDDHVDISRLRFNSSSYSWNLS